MKTLTIFALGLFISGCGGGAESSSSPQPTVAETTVMPSTTPVVETPVTTAPLQTKDLVIDRQFSLASSYDLAVEVDLQLNERAYIHLCEKADDGSAKLNACIWHGPLSGGSLKREFSIANHHKELIAEVWFYAIGKTPLRFNWQYQENADEQHFTIQ